MRGALVHGDPSERVLEMARAVTKQILHTAKIGAASPTAGQAPGAKQFRIEESDRSKYEFGGAPRRTRTSDTRFRKPLSGCSQRFAAAVRPGPPDHELLPPAPARYGLLSGG